MKDICPFVAALLAASLLTSCSIKEDRSPCPCFLNIELDGMCLAGSPLGVVSVRSESFDSIEEIDMDSYAVSGYEIAVPRKKVQASVVAGLPDGALFDRDVARFGSSESGAVWAWRQTAVCDGDDVTLRAEPHKQFCNVNLIMTGQVPDVGYRYDMVLRACCNAIDVHDFSPVEGEYAVPVTRHTGIVYSVRVPRQDSNVLTLDFYDSSEKIVHVIDLGKEMSFKGYDWRKEDLDDVYVTIDFTLMTTDVIIVEWDRNIIYEEI